MERTRPSRLETGSKRTGSKRESLQERRERLLSQIDVSLATIDAVLAEGAAGFRGLQQAQG